MKAEFDREKEKMKVTFESEMEMTHKRLTIKMKRQKEELDKIVQRRESEIKSLSKKNIG